MDKQELFNRFFPYLLALLGIIAFTMIFFEAFFTIYEEIFGYTSSKIDSYTGLQISFGFSVGQRKILPINVLSIFAYVFPLIGSVLSVLKVKDFELVKYFSIGVIFTIGGILLFLLPSFVNISASFGLVVKYATAPLIAGILSIVASFGSFYYSLKFQERK